MARFSPPAGDAAPPRATLTIEEDGARRTFRLDGAVTVGRDSACEVLLSSPTVSRRHALVAPDGEGWLVRDLGSGNGTFLDARRVDAEARLPGAVAIRFGSVPGWFEEEPEEPVTASRKIQRTISQTLSIQPARRTRKKACAAVLAGCVALLLGATAWQRGCDSRESGPARPATGTAPGSAAPSSG